MVPISIKWFELLAAFFWHGRTILAARLLVYLAGWLSFSCRLAVKAEKAGLQLDKDVAGSVLARIKQMENEVGTRGFIGCFVYIFTHHIVLHHDLRGSSGLCI